MPHYADGSEAQIGDFVVGKGYNVKDSRAELAQIAGTVLHINRTTEQCNIQVGYWAVFDQPAGPLDAVAGMKILSEGKMAQPRVEYGQVNHFHKVR